MNQTMFEEIEMVSVKAGSVTNDSVNNLSSGVQTFNVNGCNLEDSTKQDVVVVTAEGVYEANKIVK
jgi:outer membrane murein-binding lipoprotein Lpp